MHKFAPFLFIFIFVSCNTSETEGINDLKNETIIDSPNNSENRLKDLVLTEYPQEIDSLIILELDSVIASRKFTIDEIIVSHPVSIVNYKEGNDIEFLPGVDHEKYQAIIYLVDSSLNAQSWLLEFDLEFNLIKKLWSEHPTLTE
jgi:hypothetical protein